MPKFWFAQEAERDGEAGLEIVGPADSDVQGHPFRWVQADDPSDVEGHPLRWVSPEGTDDVEGHPYRWISPEGSDDVQGHPWRFIEAEGEPSRYIVEMETDEDVTGHWSKVELARDDDVEGQGLTTRPPVD